MKKILITICLIVMAYAVITPTIGLMPGEVIDFYRFNKYCFNGNSNSRQALAACDKIAPFAAKLNDGLLVSFYMNRATHLTRTKRVREAETDLQAANNILNNSSNAGVSKAKVDVQMGLTYLAGGNLEGAKALFSKHLNLLPLGCVYFYRGLSNEGLNLYGEALADYKRAFELGRLLEAYNKLEAYGVAPKGHQAPSVMGVPGPYLEIYKKSVLTCDSF